MKKGLIYVPSGKYSWNKTHAQVPVVDCINEKLWRIYFSTRDSQNQSRTSFIEVKPEKPTEILYEHSVPILELGKKGSFDENGIMPTCIINSGKEKLLYYIGWSRQNDVPYRNAIGLAKSADGINFTKVSEKPVVGTLKGDSDFCGTAYVLKQEIWKMWYLSCIKWEMIDGKMEPYYNIKYAESTDGINWKREGKVAIALKDKNEAGLTSAAVIKENKTWKMWYGMRPAKGYRTEKANSYRIGYAESNDGISWIRKDEQAGINVSKSGWDSEMLSYPYIISHKEKLVMFYNGNGFGRSGFGYAIYE